MNYYEPQQDKKPTLARKVISWLIIAIAALGLATQIVQLFRPIE